MSACDTSPGRTGWRDAALMALSALLIVFGARPYPTLPEALQALIPAVVVLFALTPALVALARGCTLWPCLLLFALWGGLGGAFVRAIGGWEGNALWVGATLVPIALGAPLCVVLRALRRRLGADGLLALAPLVWVGWELLRELVPGGTAWYTLAHAFWKLPATFQIAEITGIGPVSLAVALVNAGLARAWLGERAGAVRQAGLGVALLALLSGYGAWRLGSLEVATGPPIRTALIQSAIPHHERRERTQDELLGVHLELSERVPPGTELVVWPETAAGGELLVRPSAQARVEDLARRLRATLIVGSLDTPPDREPGSRLLANAALVYGPSGRLWDTYRKVHLVLFGEYLPLRELPPMSWLAGITPQFEPGEGFTAVDSPLGRLGVPICYEGTFPDDVRRFVLDGATLICLITNDDQLGEVGARLHYQQAVFRAVETRRWIARCANSGVSAFIDPAGRVRSHSRWMERTAFAGEVYQREGQTPYVRWGDLFRWLCAAAAVALALRRGRERDGKGPET